MPKVLIDQDCVDWLLGIAAGHIDFTLNNQKLASKVLSFVMEAPMPAPTPRPLPTVPPLSPHFTIAEMIHSDTANQLGLDNTPDQAALAQLSDLCNKTLEPIRALCGGHSVTVSSGYRAPAVNHAVGGADNSAHKFGCAADIEIPEFGTPLKVAETILPHIGDLGIDQLIYETDHERQWVHVGRAIPPSTAPRVQAFSSINGVTGFSPFPPSGR